MNQDTIDQDTKKKSYDLEVRTSNYAKNVLDLVKVLSNNVTNQILISQIIRSSTSVGANYREANDALGRKDFFMRIKICRKEAKESKYWLELIIYSNPQVEKRATMIIQESEELIKIFSKISSKA